jgi:hypothetical protein
VVLATGIATKVVFLIRGDQRNLRLNKNGLDFSSPL